MERETRLELATSTLARLRAIEVLLALGQESRLNIFRMIVQRGEAGLTPSQLIEKLGIPNATLSFHLKEITTLFHLLGIALSSVQLSYSLPILV